MKIYDITKTLDENIPYIEGDPIFKKEVARDIERDGCLQHRVCLHTHAGTHMDAPSHVVSGGANIKDISPEKFVGKCMVCENIDDVNIAIDSGIKMILIKVDFNVDFSAIDISKINLVGVESIAVGDFDTHRMLFKKNIAIIEWLDLSKVPAGEYFLAALPLKMDTDGAPARAVLISLDDLCI